MTLEQIPQSWWLLLASALLIYGSMAIESRISSRHETSLRARGAIEPIGDVWRVMAMVYPAGFAAMVIESAARGGPSMRMFAGGLAIWGAAKLLKAWVIRSLGERWSFRVLVLPGAPLVARGPYRIMRHPNYLAVIAEIAGAGTMLAAPTACIVFIAAFVQILRRRIRVEERALGLRNA